ncbi:hypothetical protein AAKU52_000223 [Pedobacter sp. CG_S7]|uniref:hypothetical protein n=1 Tax=Pedobacter sp. CG_S7 TaxID=3143930 RepID=UPI003392C384
MIKHEVGRSGVTGSIPLPVLLPTEQVVYELVSQLEIPPTVIHAFTIVVTHS